MQDQFEKDVIDGLSSEPKYLSSKYFYDKRGDELFQAIMDLPEYYLTRAEFQIFESNKQKLLEYFLSDKDKFKLIEFGAGDGLKTKVLLEHFLIQNANFNYVPIDISANTLELLKNSLKTNLPDLQVECINDDYFKGLETLNVDDETREVVLFLGSNLGNFRDEMAHQFLRGISSRLNKGDLLLMGLDLKKDPAKILAAYNDKQGVTRDFNLNLLSRINREFDGDFDLEKFIHYPTYNPITGETVSHLLSSVEQVVYLERINLRVEFKAWETIFMELSQKFELEYVERLAHETGFEVVDHLFDENHYFVNTLWRVE